MLKIMIRSIMLVIMQALTLYEKADGGNVLGYSGPKPQRGGCTGHWPLLLMITSREEKPLEETVIMSSLCLHTVEVQHRDAMCCLFRRLGSLFARNSELIWKLFSSTSATPCPFDV